MKIEIETSCQEDIEKVIWNVSEFSKDNFRQSKVFIDGKLIHEHDWRSEEERSQINEGLTSPSGLSHSQTK